MTVRLSERAKRMNIACVGTNNFLLMLLFFLFSSRVEVHVVRVQNVLNIYTRSVRFCGLSHSYLQGTNGDGSSVKIMTIIIILNS